MGKAAQEHRQSHDRARREVGGDQIIPRRSPGIRVLRMSAIPFSVSAPVVLSCNALCSALLNAIRFHGQYAYSGYSSTG
nr:MAG TPA: hypothetical protein [Caudoviricetes sp.]